MDKVEQIEELKTLMLEKSDLTKVEPVFTDNDGEEYYLDEDSIKYLGDILEQAFIPFLAEVVISAGYRKADDVRKEIIKQVLQELKELGYIHYVDYLLSCDKYGVER